MPRNWQECHQCQSSKGPPARPHGRLQKVITGEPLDIVAIDILSGLPLATNGSKYILVATDYFTKPPDEPSKPVTPYVTTFRSTIRDVHHRIRLRLFILDLLHTSHVNKTVSSSDVAIINVCIYSGTRFAPIYVPNYASSVCITIFFL